MRPYQIVAEHRLAEEGNWPQGRCKPPGWLLDKIAHEKLYGGYGKRNVKCTTCFVLKSVSGQCGCTE